MAVPIGIGIASWAHGHVNAYCNCIREFVDALKSGVPLCSAREGRVSVEMVLAAYQSAETGQRIAL